MLPASGGATLPATAVLYSAWFCPYAQRVWACLNHLRVEYELVEALGSGFDGSYRKDPDLLKANPKGLVPTLVLTGDGGQNPVVKCESIEILKDLYLERTGGIDNKPDAATIHGLAQEATLWNQKICSPFYRALMKPDDAGRRQGWEDMVEGLVAFSEKLRWQDSDGNTRAVGFYGYNGEETPTEPSLVDFCVYPFVRRLCIVEHYRGFRLEDAAPADSNAKIKSWHERMESLPAVQRTIADRERLLLVYERYADGTAQSKVGDAVRQGREAHQI